MCKVYSCYYDSPLGRMLLSARGEFLMGAWFVGQKYCGEPGELLESHPALIAAKEWLNRYFSGENPDPMSLALNPGGTAFQQAVWAGLLQIPYGQTVTYGALAKALGCGSARAVGGAVGRNPISVIIPCHRVIGAEQRLTGYAGGLERKARLLELEA